MRIRHDDFCPCTRFRAQPEFCQCGVIERAEIVEGVSRAFGQRLREINQNLLPAEMEATHDRLR